MVKKAAVPRSLVTTNTNNKKKNNKKQQPKIATINVCALGYMLNTYNRMDYYMFHCDWKI